MNREEFEARIREIKEAPELAGMEVTVIVFNDGERHLAQLWTIQPGDEGVLYIDVHCNPDSSKMHVPYRVIAEVRDYLKPSK